MHDEKEAVATFHSHHSTDRNDRADVEDRTDEERMFESLSGNWVGNIEHLEMNLRHPSRTSIRINYTVLYIMPCTVSRLRVRPVPSMDRVLKMLGHVGLSFI